MKKQFAVFVLVIAILVVTNFPCHGADKVIYGCYGKIGGILRIVSTPTACLKLEVPISWNQVGPQGPQGLPGAKGDPGIQGPPGAIKVYDANKQFLGYMLGELATNIFVPQLQVIVNLDIFNGGDIREVYVYFESTDCSGVPYVDVIYLM